MQFIFSHFKTGIYLSLIANVVYRSYLGMGIFPFFSFFCYNGQNFTDTFLRNINTDMYCLTLSNTPTILWNQIHCFIAPHSLFLVSKCQQLTYLHPPSPQNNCHVYLSPFEFALQLTATHILCLNSNFVFLLQTLDTNFEFHPHLFIIFQNLGWFGQDNKLPNTDVGICTNAAMHFFSFPFMLCLSQFQH